jgi:hypothetical protein
MRILAFTALAVPLVFWGCAGSLPLVKLDAAPRDVERLAGEWIGQYAVDGSGERTGNIMFRLIAGESEARGDVLMMSPPSRQSHLGRWDDVAGEAQYLAIQFVRIEDGLVSGAMDLYWDPDRDCWAATVFQGRLVGDTIAGRFRTRFSRPLQDVEGSWKVNLRKTGTVRDELPR